MKKVAINGFGRIGRLVFRIMESLDDLEVVAINDLTNAETLAYLLKYDTSHGKHNVNNITFEKDELIVNNKHIKIYSEKDPVELPWGELGVDVVFECTGFFKTLELAGKHITAGAKKVIISAPGEGDMKSIVYNVNHDTLDGSERVINTASCTTNCLAPVVDLLNKNYGVKEGYMTTIHAYTNDQNLLDKPHSKGINSRRGRAGAANIIPTSTGAAKAIGKVIPELEGKLKGSAIRVPVTAGSMIDLTLKLNKNTTKEEINELFNNNQNESIKITYDPIVSSDILGSYTGALVDGLLTDVIDVDEEQLVKIIAWYDNEMGYSAQMVRTAIALINK